ncbi:MAG: outer membrane protein assembly factor BamD [Bryobacteraceae bacterium]|jgi:outer membrane protein assembly factor BamD
MSRNVIRPAAVVAVMCALVLAPGCRKKKYENPITKETQQPDKVLFDRAVDDIEHARYEQARLTLQTLMNTYDTSEYLAKAKLAVADSWYREGGSHGLAQAEAEYKDFILFYPQMEEAAEAQEKVCKMQYQQMDKSERDPLHARRAEEECRQLLVQFPNSKFAPDAQQYLRTAQEVLADAEFRVGAFYYRSKGSFPAAAARLTALTDQFPLYSRADDALMLEADAYHRMGDRFEDQEAAAYGKIVREYPLSSYVAEATNHLKAMNRPVPEADPVAYARQKYELENRQKRGLLSKVWEPFSSKPDVLNAAKSGSPRMETLKPYTPVSIPASAKGTEATGSTGVSAGGGGSDVTASTVNDSKLIDAAPDARQNPGAGQAPAAGAESGKTDTSAKPAADPAMGPGPNAPLPQNHTGKITAAQQAKLMKKQEDMARKRKEQAAKEKKKAEEEQAKKDKKKKVTTAPVAPQPQPQPADAGGSTIKQ